MRGDKTHSDIKLETGKQHSRTFDGTLTIASILVENNCSSENPTDRSIALAQGNKYQRENAGG